MLNKSLHVVTITFAAAVAEVAVLVMVALDCEKIKNTTKQEIITQGKIYN